MAKVKEITLPWPEKVLHSNPGTSSRFAKAAATKRARTYAWAVAKESPSIDCMPNATLVLEYYPPTRRGDIHNVAYSMKAYIDGIADAMGCDDKGFDVHYPTVWAGSGKPGKVVLRIIPPIADVPLVGAIS